MMTNKKLLEEITVRSQNDNKALREQLRYGALQQNN